MGAARCAPRPPGPAGAGGGIHAYPRWGESVMNSDRALPAPPGQELGAFLGAPGPGSSRAHAEDSPFLIFQKVHRLLRGRYPAALSLAALGALAGGAAGYFSTTPKYMSQGSIRVAPTITTVFNDPTGGKNMPP